VQERLAHSALERQEIADLHVGERDVLDANVALLLRVGFQYAVVDRLRVRCGST
jgi:hypothetical protein